MVTDLPILDRVPGAIGAVRRLLARVGTCVVLSDFET